jgi:hypothetical protein
MADVRGAGTDGHGDNPSVTSKFDRDHGEPRSPGKVGTPGGTAEPTFAHKRVAPTSVTHAAHGKVHHYGHDHPAMGGQHHGTKPIHPTHDATQASYEKHGYGGKVGK